jgi:hypothetical protein
MYQPAPAVSVAQLMSDTLKGALQLTQPAHLTRLSPQLLLQASLTCQQAPAVHLRCLPQQQPPTTPAPALVQE